jgi:nucleoid-associated protein YgaU
MDGRGGTFLKPPWKEIAVKLARLCAGALISIGLPLFATLSGGCQNKDGGVPSSSSATDISASPAYTPAPSYSPAQPVYDSTPVIASAVTPAYSTNSVGSSQTGNQIGTSGGGSYVVRKGDTLYGIARTHYGDGKKWQQIASANPGLSPSSLKVGQTITLP